MKIDLIVCMMRLSHYNNHCVFAYNIYMGSYIFVNVMFMLYFSVDLDSGFHCNILGSFLTTVSPITWRSVHDG